MLGFKKRHAYWLTTMIFGALLAWLIVDRVVYSTASIVVDGPHDYKNTAVYANGKKLEPTETDKRIYELRGLPGDYKIKLVGPTVESVEADARLSPLSSQLVEVKTKEVGLDEAAAALIDLGPNESLSSIHVFGNTDWMVATVDDGGSDQNRKLYVLNYDYSKGIWQVAASGIKINALSLKSNSAPKELLEYVAEAGGD